MSSKKPVPKKQPKSIRPPADLNEASRRLLESHRVLTTEMAQLLCELQECVLLVQETRRKRALQFPARHC